MIDMGVVMDKIHAVADFLRSFFQGPPDVRECYAVLAARREPIFRDIATGPSPWAGRRRNARRRESEAA